MHLHLGFKADRLDPDVLASLPPQWTVVSTWDGPIDGPGKVVVVSMPSLLDPSLAPEGYHVIHAYAAGNEPFEPWAKFDTMTAADHRDAKEGAFGDARYRQDPEYLALKAERVEAVWRAVERRIPNIRDPGVCDVAQVGTPLTHKRFLRRHRGNYGPAIAAGNANGLAFPGVKTALPGLYRCGDSTTSGIGVPAVASSGAQCANAMLSVWEQLDMNSKIRM